MYHLRNIMGREDEAVLPTTPDEDFSEGQHEDCRIRRANNKEALEEAYEAITKAVDFMDQLQKIIDSIRCFGGI